MKKEIATLENISFDELEIGDLVNGDVIDDLANCLPPACMRLSCFQLGEPYSHREDPDSGAWRATYATFKIVSGDWKEGIWEYCGHCFRGETTERGKDPAYVASFC